MTSTIDPAAAPRRSVRRRNIVTFTMGRATFRLILVGLIAGIGAAFGGGYFFGRTIDVSAETTTKTVASIALPAPPPKRPALAAAPTPAAAPSQPSEPEPPPSIPTPPPARPPVEVRTEAPTRGYGLQLGAFEHEEDARAFIEAHRDALRERRVFLLTSEVPNRGVWHRVRWGQFKNKRRARRAKKQLDPIVEDVAIVVNYR